MWYPDRSKATEKDPPLYLHLSASSKEMLQKAIDKVNELIAVDLGPLVEDKKDRLREKVLQLYCSDVSPSAYSSPSVNGRKRKCLWASRPFAISTFVPKLLGHRYV